MAYMIPSKLDEGIAKHGLPALTPNTITTRERLTEELARVREQGFAFDNEEWQLGVKCVGAPVFNENGDVIAGVSCSGPAQRFTGQILLNMTEYVKETAEAISRRLGHRANG